MSFAIVCPPRNRPEYIKIMALCDRKKTKHLWWTCGDDDLIKRFHYKSAALAALRKLNKNGAYISNYRNTVNLVRTQRFNMIREQERVAQ